MAPGRPFWAVSGASWWVWGRVVGGILAVLGSLVGILARLGLARVALGTLRGSLGGLLGPLGRFGSPFGAILWLSWDHLGSVLAPSGTHNVVYKGRW